MKKCSKCGIEKEACCFYKNKASGDGLNTWCKECSAIYIKQYYLNNKETIDKYRKKYFLDNKEKISEYKKKYHSANKEKIAEHKKKYRLENKEKISEYKKKYHSANKEKIRARTKLWRENNKERRNKYEQEKVKTDINYRIKRILRGRLYFAIKNKNKQGSAVKDLGCSIEQLKQHLEQQFKPGMSWKNYGKWHIDHIKPLASFNLTKRSQLKKACNYTNLQPLWAKENLQKGDKLCQT